MVRSVGRLHHHWLIVTLASYIACYKGILELGGMLVVWRLVYGHAWSGGRAMHPGLLCLAYGWAMSGASGVRAGA